MKIGVFGDSFACLKLNSTPTWVNILSEKYDIVNHAVTGSNLYYSINEKGNGTNIVIGLSEKFI
jgi:hypothetical protein